MNFAFEIAINCLQFRLFGFIKALYFGADGVHWFWCRNSNHFTLVDFANHVEQSASIV